MERRGDVDLNRNRKLVVLSGGQDSTTCLFKAVHDPMTTELQAISFDYDQRHKAELASAAFVYELAYLNKPLDLMMRRYRHVVKLPRFHGDSPLTNKDRELELYRNVQEMDAKLQDRVELTFVPGRNASFLLEACKLALVNSLGTVVIGVNQADAGNYPDCRQEFISAFEEMWQIATRSNMIIEAPLQGLGKDEIVKLADSLPGCMDALAFSMTDYAGEYPPGNNHASVLRASGFAGAGKIDPIMVRARAEGLL